MGLNKKWGALLVLSLVLFAAVAAVLVYSFETKYFFSRNECRYIFKQGSCVVADEHCNLNSYNYVKKILDPRKDCVSEITFNPGYEETDLEAFDYPEQIEAEAEADASTGCAFVVREADFVKIRPEAVDPDKEIGPAGKLVWTFYNPLNQKGEWQTKTGDAGVHNTKVTVSDGEFNDTKSFCIEVIASNHAPVLAEIADILVKEGETVTIDASCTDEDGDNISITYSGWMTASSKKSGYGDSGNKSVTVTCTDVKGAKDSQKVAVIISEVNRAPSLEAADVTVKEGELVDLKVKAADADGEDVTVEISDPVGNDGTWQTKQGDAGTYNVAITATDGKDTVTKKVKVTVTAVNNAPVLGEIADVTVYEGETVKFEPAATDADGDKLTYKYSGWMTTASKKTGYDDAGEYEVTVTASDGKSSDTQKVKVTVLNKNRAPKITKVYMEEPTEAVKTY